MINKLEEIVSIEVIGLEDTVDITTDGNHLFFANGILTHNSGMNNTDPGMEHISESAGIPATADFIGNLWQQEGDVDACRINMKLIKNRLGGLVGKNLQFHVNYNTLRLSDDVNINNIENTSVTESLMTDLEDL